MSMNQLENEHFFMPTGRNDTNKQHCGICGKPFQTHTADVKEVKIIKSGPSSRPPITWYKD